MCWRACVQCRCGFRLWELELELGLVSVLDARRAELVCAACVIDWLAGVVVKGSWEGQWLSYVRVWVWYETYVQAVVYNGNGQWQWAMAAAAAAAAEVRITKSRAEGWRAPKGLSHLHVAMTRWWCKGESGS